MAKDLGLVLRIGLAGVVDQTHGFELRIEGPGQIQLPAHRIGANGAHHIGPVLTHPPGRGARPGPPRVGAVAKNHRGGGGCHLHGRLQGRGAHREDHVHLVTHELLHHQGGVGQLTGGILLDEVDGFTAYVTGLGKGRFKALAGEGGRRRIHHLQHANGGALHLGGTQFAAGCQGQGAGSSGAHQAKEITAKQGHPKTGQLNSPLWPSRRSPAMPLR